VHSISPLLIANRGEIAARIARSAHSLGLQTVGVFSAEDADAVHLESVDCALRIDGYLDIEALIAAASRAGARAVHPGYGFLSENAAFARAVAEAGLVWVGPPPEAMELMADKLAAKRAAAAAGVPVVPEGHATELPVLIKALAGGGGKGMRIVRRAEDLEEALAAARREAQNAFGDDRVMLERYIERPRHIEVQVLADRHSAVVHLGERECTLQRRHQKVVEEAPSPTLDAEQRERIGAAAVALARACGYEGAGTVEFVASADARELYFIEMNTRLQVEHPVTELVYGIDLVQAQLRIAAGEPLGLCQEEIAPRGHALEARLYAEDPRSGFLPCAGAVAHYREPHGEGVRVDSGIREGTVVGTRFDPLLAKVIAHGADRAQALGRLARALGELELLGVHTNQSFLRALLARPEVRSGEIDTGLLERLVGELAAEAPDDLLAAGALALAGSSSPAGPWHRRYQRGGERVEVRIQDGWVSVDGREQSAQVRALGRRRFAVELDGVLRRYTVTTDPDATLWVGRDGHQLEAPIARPQAGGGASSGGSLQAPMPGVVLQVRVADGQRVGAGEVLVVLESMKMELAITAPHEGVVSDLSLAVGDRVARGQPLVSVRGDGAAADPGSENGALTGEGRSLGAVSAEDHASGDEDL
jgi:acetyl-CoA/propionyl-CoA carboxylase biotin carboxyl carrier protein